MKIALAQIASTIGDIKVNIQRHLQAVEKAAIQGVRLIVFPELSLTGYAPELTQKLAMELNDSRLSVFQKASDQHNISVGLGVPIKTLDKPQIGMVIFEPDAPRKLYGKQFLHQDELPDFSPGENYHGPLAGRDDIALSVCYELSVDAHLAKACNMSANLYLSSVAKTAPGVANASDRLSQISRDKKMISLMVNCVGICEGLKAGGKSAIWDVTGQLIAQLNATEQALLILDTEKMDSETHIL